MVGSRGPHASCGGSHCHRNHAVAVTASVAVAHDVGRHRPATSPLQARAHSPTPPKQSAKHNAAAAAANAAGPQSHDLLQMLFELVRAPVLPIPVTPKLQQANAVAQGKTCCRLQLPHAATPRQKKPPCTRKTATVKRDVSAEHKPEGNKILCVPSRAYMACCMPQRDPFHAVTGPKQQGCAVRWSTIITGTQIRVVLGLDVCLPMHRVLTNSPNQLRLMPGCQSQQRTGHADMRAPPPGACAGLRNRSPTTALRPTPRRRWGPDASTCTLAAAGTAPRQAHTVMHHAQDPKLWKNAGCRYVTCTERTKQEDQHAVGWMQATVTKKDHGAKKKSISR